MAAGQFRMFSMIIGKPEETFPKMDIAEIGSVARMKVFNSKGKVYERRHVIHGGKSFILTFRMSPLHKSFLVDRWCIRCCIYISENSCHEKLASACGSAYFCTHYMLAGKALNGLNER